jgi:predicted SprT family Zn-dependent metalloprotease
MTTTLTLTDLNKWFNEFNAEYFDSKLPKQRLQIKSSKSYLGIIYYGKNTIIISNYYKRTEWDFKQTLLHEMIHLYNKVFDNGYRGHGKPFKEKAAEINRKGNWNIARCADISSDKTIKQEIAPKANKRAYAIVIDDYVHSGKLHFSILSPTAFENGTYARLLERYKNKGWRISLFTTQTKHYPTARVCRTRVYGHYKRREDIQKDIDSRKLLPISLVSYAKAI